MPAESSYLTDQVKWAHRNGDVPLSVWGITVAQNSVLAIAASVDEKEPLLVYPLVFPELVGRAISRGLEQSPSLFAKTAERRRIEESTLDRKVEERLVSSAS